MDRTKLENIYRGAVVNAVKYYYKHCRERIDNIYGGFDEAVDCVCWSCALLLDRVDTNENENKIAAFLTLAIRRRIINDFVEYTPGLVHNSKNGGGYIQRFKFISGEGRTDDDWTDKSDGRAEQYFGIIAHKDDEHVKRPDEVAEISEFMRHVRRIVATMSESRQKLFEILMSGGDQGTIEEAFGLSCSAANQRIREFVYQLREKLRPIYGDAVKSGSIASLFSNQKPVERRYVQTKSRLERNRRLRRLAKLEQIK